MQRTATLSETDDFYSKPDKPCPHRGMWMWMADDEVHLTQLGEFGARNLLDSETQHTVRQSTASDWARLCPQQTEMVTLR